MVIIVLGAPGSGKGTISSMLSKYYNIPHISTGEIIREKIAENKDYSKTIEQYVEKGKLVPDSILKEIVKNRLKKKDTVNGFILDGFPRTIRQANDLEEILEHIKTKIDIVIDLTSSRETIITRITNRRVCTKCDTSYDINKRPPKINNICDICQGKLVQREDDMLETISKRLEVYENETVPIISYYIEKGLLKKVDGEGEREQVFERVIND